MKKFKQNLGAMLIVGSLFVACSSTEFKSHNEWEEKAYSALKEKYPNVEFIDSDLANQKLKAFRQRFTNRELKECDYSDFGYIANCSGEGNEHGIAFLAKTKEKEVYDRYVISCKKRESGIDCDKNDINFDRSWLK